MSYDASAWYTESMPAGLGGNLPGVRRPDPTVPYNRAPVDTQPRPVAPRDSTEGIGIPHQEQFAAQYAAGFKKYWSKSDEALRDNWQNALAMRRDAFTEELLSLRTFPVVSLQWDVIPDDLEDPEQVAVATRINRLIDSIPHYQDLKLWLKEDVFYGKSAVQVVWSQKLVDGHRGITVNYWEPVSGDSLIFDWDGAVGVLVRAGWNVPAAHEGAVIEQADRGRVLMLRDSFWRDRFIISKFRRSGADYMYEGDIAGSMHGKGMRSRTYYAWLLRQNYLAWRQNAAQRFPINGTLVGYYPQGNTQFRDEIFNALKLMSVNNISAFPMDPNNPDLKWFERLDAPTSGYEQFGEIISEIESCIRRCWLGQEISSMAKPMGLGSGATTHAQQDTAEAYLRFDAASLDETLSTDLVNVMVKLNTFIYKGKEYGPGEDLPFGLRIQSKIEKKDVAERVQAVDTAAKIGLELSKKQLYEDLCLAAPDDKEDSIGGQALAGEMNGQGGGLDSGSEGAEKSGSNGAGPKNMMLGKSEDGKAKLHPKPGVNLNGKHSENGQSSKKFVSLSKGDDGKPRLRFNK